jgi:pimeloyl-ACP methyl ester carboxylesterase
LHKVSITDYIDDFRSVADGLGDFVIQPYLEDRSAPAAVLVGSVPQQGVIRLALRAWRRRPSMTVEAWNDRTLRKFLATPALTREYLSCADIPEDVVECWMQRAGAESVRAAMTDPMLRRVGIRRVTTPILVLGAERDGFVNTGEVRATARAYRTEPTFFSLGHNMMLGARVG